MKKDRPSDSQPLREPQSETQKHSLQVASVFLINCFAPVCIIRRRQLDDYVCINLVDERWSPVFLVVRLLAGAMADSGLFLPLRGSLI